MVGLNPQVPSAIFIQSQYPGTPQRRRVGLIEDLEVHSVKTSQAAKSPGPEIVVHSLYDRSNGVLRQAVFASPSPVKVWTVLPGRCLTENHGAQDESRKQAN